MYRPELQRVPPHHHHDSRPQTEAFPPRLCSRRLLPSFHLRHALAVLRSCSSHPHLVCLSTVADLQYPPDKPLHGWLSRHNTCANTITAAVFFGRSSPPYQLPRGTSPSILHERDANGLPVPTSGHSSAWSTPGKLRLSRHTLSNSHDCVWHGRSYSAWRILSSSPSNADITSLRRPATGITYPKYDQQLQYSHPSHFLIRAPTCYSEHQYQPQRRLTLRPLCVQKSRKR